MTSARISPAAPIGGADADLDIARRTPGSGWRGFGIHLWYSFYKLLTNPYSLGFAIGLPIFMYLMFGAGQDYSAEWIIHSNVAATVLVNMAVYGTIMTASSMGTNVALERTSGISRLQALTPMSSLAIITARMIASMLISIVVTGVVYAVGCFTGARMEAAAWIGSFILMIAVSVLPIVLGLAAAFSVRSDGAFALTSAITVLGSFAAGMFIPLEQMGSFWAKIAPWSPFYGLSRIVQTPLYGWDGFEWAWLANYAAWTAFFAIIAVWAQRRDTDR
ncbi:MAG: ABC transporter permease [Schaalia hyovaginalis]|uniref:ABC transporter permease n=1 Tax=Schaalia hyovaginalis TaxID=29316 RepID=UPI0023F61E57|nr:ABC transporter permease [Schaalia hyovaginalis]MCI7671392.1 ABC transporter permease [Schaalia hyovaginalis]MDY5505754.1 ABC transporter permease [Schaalia hyovaginalis]